MPVAVTWPHAYRPDCGVGWGGRRHFCSCLCSTGPLRCALSSAAPTAELEPLAADGAVAQTDEQDMGMTYEVRSVCIEQL